MKSKKQKAIEAVQRNYANAFKLDASDEKRAHRLEAAKRDMYNVSVKYNVTFEN